MDAKDVKALERDCEMADERLEVAEEMAAFTALFAGIAVYVLWDLSLVALVAAFLVYLAVTYHHRKAHERAWDAYQRATHTGRYYKSDTTDGPA